MAKPKDSKFNRRFSFVDNLPRNGPSFEDWERNKEYRTCGECDGRHQEKSEHLRYYLGKFMCKSCRDAMNTMRDQAL